MLRIALSVVLGPVLVLVVLFGAMGVIGVEPHGTTAQDGDFDRVTALETRIADVTQDLARLREDFAEQLLPEPRPASDFTTSQYLFTGLSENAVKLFCRANSEMEDRYVSLVCDQVETP